jgi:hypothetical protein
MERPLNRLEVPSDMPDLPWVQWRVENIEELARFVEDNIVNKFNVQARFVRIPGDQVLIQTAVLNSSRTISSTNSTCGPGSSGSPAIRC